MIRYKKGNLFEEINKVEAIVNTVNCVGVMGKGIALQFKNKFPENFKVYKNSCLNNDLKIGESLLYKIPNNTNTKFIINFPTKQHWRNPSKIEYIEKGLDNLVYLIQKNDIHSVAMPALGCGNGNLDWCTVKPLIEKKLNSLSNIEFIIFEPSNELKKNKEINISNNKPRLTQFRKKIVLLINDYNKGTKGPLISSTQIHILGYFLSLKDKKIKFELQTNGPYLNELNKMILLLSPFYISPLKHTTKDGPTQIEIKTTSFPQKKEIMLSSDYTSIKELMKGFESYDGLLNLFLAHWFSSIFENDSIKVEKQIFNWLESNGHIANTQLIQSSIKRIINNYFQPENLSFQF